MDELKIKLSTKFIKNAIAMVISKSVFKKFGIKSNIKINELELDKHNDKINLHLNIDADIDEITVLKIIKMVASEDL